MQILTDQQCIDIQVTEHAKLFQVEGRQVLAYLERDGDDNLVVILQAWVAKTDEQLRALISFANQYGYRETTDAVAATMFANLNDEMIPILMQESGLTATLEEAERG